MIRLGSIGSATNGELIKKCSESLTNWIAKENDESELELHAELWTTLGRLALNEKNVPMLKYSLRCVETALSTLKPKTDVNSNARL